MSGTNIFYWLFVGIALAVSATSCFRDRQAQKIGQLLAILLTASFLLMVADRKIFSDAAGYRDFFFSIERVGFSVFERGFELYTLAFANTLGWTAYLLSFPLALLGSSLFLYKTIRTTPNYRFATFVLLCWPFVWAYSTTGFRQSIAIALCILAITEVLRTRFVLAACFLVGAPFFHSSSLLVLSAIPAFVQKIRTIWVVLFWSVSIFAGLYIEREMLQTLIPTIMNVSDRYDVYLDSATGSDYRSGIRTDFVSFSAIPLIAYYLRNPRKFAVEAHLETILRVYLMLNATANFFSSIPYSDRVYAYSWILAPTIIATVWEELPQASRAVVAALLFYFVLLYSTHWLGI